MSQELQAAVRNLSVAVDELMGLSNIMRDDVFQILNALATYRVLTSKPKPPK